MKKTLLFFLSLSIAGMALYFRFFNLEFSYLEPDSGYELEAARMINLTKKMPLIGPALSQPGLFIPPTYLNIISLLYFLGDGQIAIISLSFAFFGLLTVFFLALLIYLITNDKRIAILFFAMFSVWKYSIIVSRTIWHPHPLFLFLSVSLFFLVLALKKNVILYLFLSHWFFFFSLSIYPSPIIFLPTIAYGSFIFFNRNQKNFLINIFYTFFSLFCFFIIIYLPQIIFEINNHFQSFKTFFTVVELNKSSSLDLATHFYTNFQLFLSLFFTTESKIIEFIFLIFVLFLIASNSFNRNIQNDYVKIFTTPLVFFWIFIILIFLKSQSFYSLQRIDVLSILFFILLAINLSTVINLKPSILKFFSYIIMLTFFIFFLIINLKDSSNFCSIKNVDSSFVYEKIANSIVNEIKQNLISIDKVYIFNDIAYQNENYLTDPGNYLWYRKWMAERIDHFVNKVFYEANLLVDNYQHTLNYGGQLNYLDAKYYFLICREYDEECISRFLQSMYSFGDKFKLKIDYQFFVIKSSSLNTHDDISEIKIYLLKKQNDF